MRTIFLGLIMALAVGCNMPMPTELGEKFEVDNPISIDVLLEKLQDNHEINNVQVEGEIYKSCLSEGCWLTIKDKSGNANVINVKDKKFRLPNTSAGKKAIILLDAKVGVLESDENKEPKLLLNARGIKFEEKDK
jgi:hypothetical protein